MNVVFLGDAIRKKRKALKITQEQLCQGICEPITISRLETGKQLPSYNRLRAILDRLDMPADRFYCLLTQQEVLMSELYSTILDVNVRIDQSTTAERPIIRQQGLNAIARLEAIMDRDDLLSRQLILRSKSILGEDSGEYSFEIKWHMLMDAIRMTSPDFSLDRIGQGLYTADELKIINQFAILASEQGNNTQALRIFDQLYHYIREHYREISPLRSRLILVAHNYASELVLAGQYEKAIAVAEEGRRLSLIHDSFQFLPGLLSHLAESHHLLGHDDISRSLYIQCYYTLMATEDHHNMEIIQKEARRYLSLELPI